MVTFSTLIALKLLSILNNAYIKGNLFLNKDAFLAAQNSHPWIPGLVGKMYKKGNLHFYGKQKKHDYLLSYNIKLL